MQYTIRNIPKHVDELLRVKARRQKKSLNALVVETLAGATGVGAKSKRKRDLSRFRRTWVEDPGFDQAMKDFERIDEDMWK